jgi:hypothetical protein
MTVIALEGQSGVTLGVAQNCILDNYCKQINQPKNGIVTMVIYLNCNSNEKGSPEGGNKGGNSHS